MKAELVAERVVGLPVGPVRLTLARHDDGHYTVIAVVVDTGQRIGLLTTGPLTDGVVRPASSLVNTAVAGPEVADGMERLLRETVAGEAMVAALAGPEVGDPAF